MLLKTFRSHNKVFELVQTTRSWFLFVKEFYLETLFLKQETLTLQSNNKRI